MSDQPCVKMLPFIVPSEIGAYYRRRLKKTKLLELFTLNRSDLIDLVGIVYSMVATDSDQGQYADAGKGFASFCDFLTEAMLAAPTQRHLKMVDSREWNLNFVGEAILDQLDKQSLRIQDLYTRNGDEKHPIVWEMVADFVRYAAIEAFRNRVADWNCDDLAQAVRRWKELQEGKRKMKTLRQSGVFD